MYGVRRWSHGTALQYREKELEANICILPVSNAKL